MVREQAAAGSATRLDEEIGIAELGAERVIFSDGGGGSLSGMLLRRQRGCDAGASCCTVTQVGSTY